jgi:hypothetical protein
LLLLDSQLLAPVAVCVLLSLYKVVIGFKSFFNIKSLLVLQ